MEIIRRRGETKKTTKNNNGLTEVGDDVGIDQWWRAGEGLLAAAAPFSAVKHWWRQRSREGASGCGNGYNFEVVLLMDARTWWALR